MTEVKFQNGAPLGLGAVIVEGGVNFSVYSKSATGVELCLFDCEAAEKPSVKIELDPVNNRTGNIWHIMVQGLGAGALYLYKVTGPYVPPSGLRFNPQKYLFDPYAKAFTRGSVFRSYNKLRRAGMDTGDPVR